MFGRCLPGPFGLRKDERRIPAVILLDATLDDLPGAVADLVKEPAVVGHHHQRQRTLRTQVGRQPGNRLNVQMVGRLVKDQQVDVIEDQGGQFDSSAFTTGQLPQPPLEPLVIEPAQQSSQAIPSPGFR